MVPDILKDSGAFVCQCQAVQQEFLLAMPDPADGGTKIICNSRNCPPTTQYHIPKYLIPQPLTDLLILTKQTK